MSYCPLWCWYLSDSIYWCFGVWNICQWPAKVSCGSYEIGTLDLTQEIFNFGFYFSFERDLTLSLQQLNDKTKTVGSEEMYFWNLRMLKTMMANELVT